MDITGPNYSALAAGRPSSLNPADLLAGKKKYIGFCHKAGLVPLPATELHSMQFIALAVDQGLKHQTIKSYLSAIRHLQVSCGGGDPKISDMPQVSLMLRGVRKEQAGIPT